MNEKQRSATLAGAGTLSGGTYERVSISGAGRIEGDVVAQEIHVSGSAKCEGRVEAKEMHVSGSVVFAKDVVADELKVSGSGRVEGNAQVKEFKCSGSFRAAKDLSGEYIKSSGRLHVACNLECDIFKASGGFEIGGLLSADRVDIELAGRSQAREIGGETISVQRGGWRDRGILLDGLVRLFVGSGAAELHVAQVEGDDVLLEDTIADVVRGKRVEIGRGCRIGKVEYTESLQVDPDAEVREKVKV